LASDYVWTDGGGGLWRVCLRGKVEMLHYWNSFAVAWVPLRETRYPDDAWMLEMPGLSQAQADLYNLLSRNHGGPG
jgi:hypothetical protein